MGKPKTAGTAAAAVLVVLAVIAFFVFVGVAFWSWVIMLVVGAAKPAWDWSYWHSMFPWGIVAGLVLGTLTGNRTQVNKQTHV